ncbi:MAG: alkaline phosphatase family protein [Bdellovibrionales bacterium]|nr:alkaline phosphatase family protein [Bdellovibrionales bacterium]
MIRIGLILFSFALISCTTAPRSMPYKDAVELLSNNQSIPMAQPLSILQGATDDTSTQISIVLPADTTYEFKVSTPQKTPPSYEITHHDSLSAAHKVVVLNVKELELGPIYRLDVIDKNQNLVDYRFFKALESKAQRPRMAVISCTSDRMTDIQKSQWNLVAQQKPDLLLLIGDNVYVDARKGKDPLPPITDQLIFQRYLETRQALELYQFKVLIPTLAAWDDHDYGGNNSNRNFAYRGQSLKIFKTFFPQSKNKVILESGPGASALAKYGDQFFVFFDDRLFRSEKGHPEETHFGRDQEEWFYNILKREKGPFWLISGDQFFGGYHEFESYEGDHPRSFKTFLEKIKSSKKTVAFLSGDRHLAEVMRIPKATLGYETYELTSSGLHAKVFPGSLAKSGPHTRSLFGRDGIYHFMMLEPVVDTKAPHKKLNFKAQFIGPDGKSFYENTFKVEQ